jgi:hypothetical protein
MNRNNNTLIGNTENTDMNHYEIGNFSECSTRERMMYSGKNAEQQAELFFHNSGIKFQRYGWNGSEGYLPSGDYQRISATLRAKPDYIVKQTGNYSLVEVKGCGNAGLKIKLSSIGAMRDWHKKAPVLLFIWHGSKKQFAFLSLGKLMELTTGLNVMQFENDGREYYQIPCSYFNWQTP